jgi:hypothetical protein
MSTTSPVDNDATALARRQRVTVACTLVVLLAALNIVGPMMPKSEGDIGFGIVSALIALVAAWGLATLRRWRRVVTIVVAVLSVLSDAPAVAVGSTVLIKVVAAATVLGWVAVLVLLGPPNVPRGARPPSGRSV